AGAARRARRRVRRGPDVGETRRGQRTAARAHSARVHAPAAVRHGRTGAMNALRSRPFRLLLGGQTVSSLGDWMATFAFIALVYEEAGPPPAAAGILALRLLPAALGGPFTARFTSVWPRRRTMITMDIARAVMVALVPLVGGLWWVYIWGSTIELA